MTPRTKDILLVAALLISTLLLADRALGGGENGGGGDEDHGLIAVTGAYGSGAAALYLIDSRTRQMAVYRLESGRGLQFVAARNCTYDFYLDSYGDRSEPQFSPQRLRRSWERHLKRGGAEAPQPQNETPQPDPFGEEDVKEKGDARLPGGNKPGATVRPFDPPPGGGGGR